MMASAERGRALQRFGYTARQAQFLALVALHGGYFLRRQYVAFTGRAHGQAAVRFIAHTTAREHVRALPYGRHGHVFHLCARPIYAAIGEEHNRNRRLAEWDAVMRKLMTLDFVLARPEATFCATEEDKVSLMRELAIRPELWPAKTYVSRSVSRPTTTRHFVDKMPWYRASDDPRLWLAYVDAERTLNGFDTFLVQYRGLLAALPSGVIYVAQKGRRRSVHAVFNKVIGGDSGRTAFPLTAFLEYCRLRRDIEAHRIQLLRVDELQRFVAIRSRFSTPASDGLYAVWLRDGDAAISSPDACAAHASRCVLAVHELGFRYGEPQPGGLTNSHPSPVT
jgi:hypothetical protein